METRHGTRPTALTGAPAERQVGGMRQAAMTALSALAGCVLLIAVGTVMSVCWAIHPALTLVAAVAVVWLASRGVGLLMRSSSRC